MDRKKKEALWEKERELARKYIESEEPDERVLEELNRLCKSIYLYLYHSYVCCLSDMQLMIADLMHHGMMFTDRSRILRRRFRNG